MNIDQLKQLVNKGESDHVEFKLSTSQLKAAMQTACAFLNLKGGVIIFGIKNNVSFRYRRVITRLHSVIDRTLVHQQTA